MIIILREQLEIADGSHWAVSRGRSDPWGDVPCASRERRNGYGALWVATHSHSAPSAR